MTVPHAKSWSLRLEACRQALNQNGFKAYVADDPAQARSIAMEQIFADTKANSISWGDSMTMRATGVLDEIAKVPGIHIIKTFEDSVPRTEIIERRRQALLVDLFFTGSNAITANGQLVNLDMIGNRIVPIAFGPRHVVIMAGRNKIVANLAAAMQRIKQIAAPMNAMRHDFKTPCVKTGKCHDCKGPQRICNTWSIIEKSYPRGRIRVILINQDLGL